MTLEGRTTNSNITHCTTAVAMSGGMDSIVNVDVTTCFQSIPANALLNEDGVTPIMNEDNIQEILVE